MKLHENFNQKTLENDIALLKLSQDAKFTKSVHPACLPIDDLEYTGVKARIALLNARLRLKIMSL